MVVRKLENSEYYSDQTPKISSGVGIGVSDSLERVRMVGLSKNLIVSVIPRDIVGVHKQVGICIIPGRNNSKTEWAINEMMQARRAKSVETRKDSE